MKFVGSSLDMTSKGIVNLVDPSAPQGAATKNYVDQVVRGLAWKTEVRAASTGNVTLATPGTSIDGVTLTSGDRVLLKDQTAASANGIYTWTGASTTLTRTLDADSWDELTGSTVSVISGTISAGKVYTCNTPDGGTLGTTNVSWTTVGGSAQTYIAGDGLTLSGSTFNVVAGTGINVAADSISLDTAVVVRKYSTLVGNGTLTSLVVTHNLNNQDVDVIVRDASTREEVWVDNVATTVNTVTLTFGTAPASNAYRAIVFG